jgi:zinc protease
VSAVAEVAHSSPTVLVESSPALPVVSMTIAARAGATSDPDGKEGLLRTVARLMRRTGDGLTTEAIDEKIDALGGSIGVDVGHSVTSIHATVIERSLDELVDLLVGILSRPSLAEEELGRLKRETVADLVEARENDRDLGQRWFRRRLFEGHPYARSIGGTLSSIESLSHTDVVAQYAKTICSENLVFAFAGDVEETRARAIAARISGAVPGGEKTPDRVPEPVMKRGRRLVIVDKPERTQTQILIGCLGTHPADEDHVALHVGNTIFGGTFTARLMNEVRSKRGWSYGAYSNLPYDRHRRGFSLWTFPKASDAAACIELELALLEKWWDSGVTARELAWAQRYLVRSHAFAIDTAAKRVGQALDEVLYDLPAGYHSEYLERVKSTTIEQVNAAIRSRITPKDLVLAVVGTASEIQTDVVAKSGDLDSVEVIAYDRDE